MTIPFAIIWATTKAWAGPLLGGVFGWVFGDWRRIVALLVLIALVTTFIVADRRRAHIDAAYWQAKIDAQAKTFIKAADAAATAETKRQADIGSQITKAFQDQIAARDAAQAKSNAAMEAQIAQYQKQMAADGRACALSNSDLRLLNTQP